MEGKSDGLTRFDEYAAEQRTWWSALRDGGVITPEDEAVFIRAEVQRLGGYKPVPRGAGDCVPDGDTSSGEKR